MKEILDLVEKFIENVDQGIGENLASEYHDEYYSTTYTTYSVQSDVEELLLDIGKILKNEELVNLFKKPKTIQEIVSELKDNTSLSDFEELEEIETTRDADREPKYVYIIEIVKHIPSGKFYQFSTQTQGDYFNKPKFDGEVVKKEITTTQWVNRQATA